MDNHHHLYKDIRLLSSHSESPLRSFGDSDRTFSNTYAANATFSPALWSTDFDYLTSDDHQIAPRSWPHTRSRALSSSRSSSHTDPKVTFVPVDKSDIHFYPREASNNRALDSRSPRVKGADSEGPSTHRKKLKNDANNNFLRKSPVFQISRWSDVNVFNRTDVLALPKPQARGFKEDRRSEYWISRRPPRTPPGGRTVSAASPRLEELAKPLYNRGEWKGTRHCTWDRYDKRRPQNPGIDPSQVNWARLAAPKIRDPPNFREIFQPVPCSALRATKRLIKLAEPKKKIDCNDFYLWLWNRKPKNESRLKKVRRLSIDKTDLVDARVFLRCDLDYTTGKPIEEKIAKIVPTILWAFKKKARALVITSHCGTPNGRKDPKFSLEKLQEPLEEALGMMVVFLDDCVGSEAMALSEDPEPGYVFLLENTLFHCQEQGYRFGNDGQKVPCTTEEINKFRDNLYGEGDVYINDAFTLLNSDVLTNVGPPEQERAYGLSVKRELAFYNSFIVSPGGRMVAVIGGMFEEVEDLVNNFMGKASEILLGGHVAYCFIKTLMDVEMGEVVVTQAEMRKVRKLMVRARDTSCIINLPSDIVVQNVKSPGTYYTSHTKDGLDDFYEPVDIGPFTRCCYKNVMLKAEKIVWFGMMGDLLDGTSAIACFFSQAECNGIQTYLADDVTADAFFRFCPRGQVYHITEDSAVTMMLLRRKTPRGLSTLSPYRKKIKKRPPKPVFVSTKPTSYDSSCMRLDNALDRLSVDQIDLKDKVVLLRATFDVPIMDKGNLRNNYCLRMIIPTVKYLLQSSSKAVVIVGSIRDVASRGSAANSFSMRPMAIELEKLLKLPVKFVPEVSFTRVKNILKDSYPGTVIFVENVNLRKEEGLFGKPVEDMTFEQEEQVASFCQEFSKAGDVYINDAFGSLHENTATASGCLLRQRACGFLQKSELKHLSVAFLNPQRPFLIILGGNSPVLKFDALRSIMCEVDQVIITGALAFGFLKLVQNVQLGNSMYDPGLDGEVIRIISMATEHDVKLYFPVDFVMTESNDSGQMRQVSASTGIPAGWKAVDIGDKSCSLFRQVIKRSKLILWHGVAGQVERTKFARGTNTMMDAVMMATQDPETQAVSIISGMSLCNFVNYHNPDSTGISHVTTGGLAIFSLIKDKSLPSLRHLSGAPIRRPLFRLFLEQVEIKDMAILIRANLNLPVEANGMIQDASFIKELANTIKYLQKKGAKRITVIGHRGKPRGDQSEDFSLSAARRTLESILKQDIEFLGDGIEDKSVALVQSTEGGKVLMFENLRYHPEEKGCEWDKLACSAKLPYQKIFEFRALLNRMCDIYVNESLDSLRLCDSSVVGVPCRVKVGGLILKKELVKFRAFLDRPPEPLLAIVGAHNQRHIISKLEMTFDLLDNVTDLMLCGDVAWHFIKVLKGKAHNLGGTYIDLEVIKYIPQIIHKANLNDITIYLPTDCLINEMTEVSNEDIRRPSLIEEGTEEDTDEVKLVPVAVNFKTGLKADQSALDIGPETVNAFTDVIKQAKNIVLLGPAGEFTLNDYKTGCQGIISAIDEARREEGAFCLAFGYDTNMMLRNLDAVNKVDHISMGTKACVDLIRGTLLPGLEALSPPLPKPLKKLSVESFFLNGMRVLLRLDLDIPIVEGIILDRTKIDAALPTIRYLLDRDVKCVTILGHRGRPRGYKNEYLTLEPLVEEFSSFLQTKVKFLEEPCSFDARAMLEDPPKGTVFLMENLKFYPAEDGRDAPRPKSDEEQEEEVVEDSDGPAEEGTMSARESEKDVVPSDEAETAEVENEGDENENEDANAAASKEAENMQMIMEASDPDNIDKLMYQLMPPKTVKEYIEELSECGDIFVNDDVQDVKSRLTSMGGFECRKKMCGLQLTEYIAKYDTEAVYEMYAVSSLTVGPKEGMKDELVLN